MSLELKPDLSRCIASSQWESKGSVLGYMVVDEKCCDYSGRIISMEYNPILDVEVKVYLNYNPQLDPEPCYQYFLSPLFSHLVQSHMKDPLRCLLIEDVGNSRNRIGIVAATSAIKVLREITPEELLILRTGFKFIDNKRCYFYNGEIIADPKPTSFQVIGWIQDKGEYKLKSEPIFPLCEQKFSEKPQPAPVTAITKPKKINIKKVAIITVAMGLVGFALSITSLLRRK